MLIRKRRDWELPEKAATPENVHRDRRRFIAAMGVAGAIAAAPALLRTEEAAIARPSSSGAAPADTASVFPAPRNPSFVADRPLTAEGLVTSYNNFYEFGSHTGIAEAAQALPVRPWSVVVDGLVERPLTVGIDDLLRRMPMEERVYRHRCVETWSMTVPWTGFPLKALVDFARPLSSARFVRFETFQNPDVAPGQRQTWYPWPYVEGLTMAEATNELAFLAVGLYGKPLPNQNGAPVRLAVPWKYGFKSAKSIVRLTFAEARPVSFWERLVPAEYGFWANVNPDVPHPRWSQATELPLGTEERVRTRLFNGYGEFVASLYRDLEGERLFI